MSASLFRRRDAGSQSGRGWGPRMDRRNFLRLSGGAAVAGAVGVAAWQATSGAQAAGTHPEIDGRRFIALGGTDGWVSMPTEAAPMPPVWPDAYAEDYAPGTNLYVFGFRDITHIHDAQFNGDGSLGEVTTTESPMNYKNGVVACAPLLWCVAHEDVYVRLYNLGLLLRPDLSDSHTVHWHGFPNQVPYFDGVPEPSFSVPIGSYATYRYIPTEPGTYMYHCHFEDVEHVQMGMQGMVFVRPRGWSQGDPSTWTAYGQGTDTQYQREYSLMIDEFDVIAHYNDSHLQVSNWVEYHPTFGLLNGRSYPDTIAGNTDPDNPPAESDPLYRLRFQPLTSLVEAQPGERVLIRFAHLGFLQHSLVMPGIPMHVVGVDGKYVGEDRDGYQNFGLSGYGGSAVRADERWVTNTLSIGPGEARDVIFVAPDAEGDYEFYDRDLGFASGTGNSSVYGGMRTIVRVRGGLPQQTRINETFTTTSA